MNGCRSAFRYTITSRRCTKWGECHFFSCLCQTLKWSQLAMFFLQFSFVTFALWSFFDVSLHIRTKWYAHVHEHVALKHIMLHFHSGNDKLKEHFAAPCKKILPSSTASDCYGHCETYVFMYFHMQHVVTCLDSLRVRGYTFSRMGCRKQWGGTGLFYDRDESTWSDSADSLRRFFVSLNFFFIASPQSLYLFVAAALAIWFVQCLLCHEYKYYFSIYLLY